MRERNRLGAELRALEPRRDSELEEARGPPPLARELVMVVGVDFPEYAEALKPGAGTCSGGSWKLGKTRLPTGAAWRLRAHHVAEARLLADPTLKVTLFDFFGGTRETVRRTRSGLSTSVDERLGALSALDYRRSDPSGEVLSPLVSVCADGHPQRPSVRLYPSVSGLGAGPVERESWLALAGSALGTTKPNSNPRGWSLHGLSVRHVYAYVETIGRSRPGTIVGLHLFGHASSAHRPNNGTAFVNTDDPRPVAAQTGARHPLDLDARAHLDFLPTTMDLAAFARAFAADARSHIWGCNWHRPVLDMITKARAQLLKDERLEDHRQFTLTWRDAGSQGTEEEYRRYFKVDPATWCRSHRTVQLSGREVRGKLQEHIDLSYMQKLANASRHEVAAGLPGTYAEYDDAPKVPLNRRATHIPMGRSYFRKPGADAHDFVHVFGFFERHFGVSFDLKEKGPWLHAKYGRGFALYQPK